VVNPTADSAAIDGAQALNIRSIERCVATSLSTKIQVSEETRAGLNRYASRMKRKLGRRVTFDETIRELLKEAGEPHYASTDGA